VRGILRHVSGSPLSATDPFISANGLVKRYGSLTAVGGLSLNVHQGECLGLLGPNGAGKSTTISMMLGLLVPDEGTVRLSGGGNPTDPVARKRLGAAPQSLSLYEDLTGEENIAFFGKLYGLTGAKLASRVEESLRFVGLFDRRKDRMGTYSGGMARRLNLACAIVHEPEAVLLDEPTVGVDPQSRNQLFENVEKLKVAGRTILYTTHYMEEAERLCDRIAIIDNGKLLALGTLDELLEAHGGSSSVEVEFTEAPDGPLGIEGATLEGKRLRVQTRNAAETVVTIAKSGRAFDGLRVRRPTLEDVFLALTGRSLRDE
jgi:ABC-2 type transport system ATP-binding protein